MHTQGGTMPAKAPPHPTRAPPTRSAPPHPLMPWRRARSPAPLPHTVSVQYPHALLEPFSLHSPCIRPERTANACTTDAAATHRHLSAAARSESVFESERPALLPP